MNDNYAPEDIARVQYSLNDSLNYWLYGSILSISIRKLWRDRRAIDVNPLIKCAVALQKSGVSFRGIALHELSQGHVSVTSYVQVLALHHKAWQQHIPHASVACTMMPIGIDFDTWLANIRHNVRYGPVFELHKLLLHHDDLFLRAIVHGSVATLDDTLGFSDLDLAFVIRSEVLKNPEKLLHLRAVAAEILALTYAFDPFMHHGPYYISEIDLAWYPEAMFPSVLFGYGVDLLDDSQELEMRTRPSEDVTDQMLDIFERFFEKWLAHPFKLKDSYDLEWVLGSAMILPALYLQRKTGEFRYKRDTFPLAKQDFSTEEWEPIRTATELRANLGPRPKPSRLLVWVARRLRWPGLLQRWGRHHPQSVRRAQETAEVLGPDYPKRVLRLLQSMRSKLHHPASKAA